MHEYITDQENNVQFIVILIFRLLARFGILYALTNPFPRKKKKLSTHILVVLPLSIYKDYFS